jgi:hypothetical protein
MLLLLLFWLVDFSVVSDCALSRPGIVSWANSFGTMNTHREKLDALCDSSAVSKCSVISRTQAEREVRKRGLPVTEEQSLAALDIFLHVHNGTHKPLTFLFNRTPGGQRM